MMTETENLINIEMLGGFTITTGEVRISEQIKRASKIWKLIQYFIVHRNKSVSQEEIIEVFFTDDEGENPGGAIRTMIYRARTALASGGIPNADELISATGGGYKWADTISCSIDTELFEALCKKAGIISCDKERLSVLLEAAALYKGDFLPNASGELWVIPLARWYRSLYIKCVHDALELLAEEERFIESEELCTRILHVEPFDEKAIGHYLRALTAQGKKKAALIEYKRMETMFFDILGVDLSENLRSLYVAIDQPESRELLSLKDTLSGWLENADFAGAYYCDFSVFKIIYQIEARSLMRSGKTTFIVRFDTKQEVHEKDGGVMKKLAEAIAKSLRKGDLFTRSSPCQYMLMLHNLTYEDSKMLVGKIMELLPAKFLTKMTGSEIKAIESV